MDFTPTPAQAALTSLTREILRDRQSAVLGSGASGSSGSGGSAPQFDPELWKVLTENGVLAAALPVGVGGDGHGLPELCSVLVELGRTLAPVPYLPTIVMAASVLARFGTPAQQNRWLRPALAGESVLTVALAEPGAGNPLAPLTRADPTPGGWCLTGTKTTVPAGTRADVLLVSATTPDGPALFAVTPDDAGTTITRQQMVDEDDAGWLELDEILIRGDRRIGGRETLPVTWVWRRGTVGVCAYQLGVLERMLELTAQYATTRTQLDRPIGNSQAVAQRLADAYINLQALRLALWNAAGAEDETGPDRNPGSGPDISAVAIAKFWAAEAGHQVAHACIHVHGGAGIDLEQPVHRYFLAAKRAEFEFGGATAQLLTLGEELA